MASRYVLLASAVTLTLTTEVAVVTSAPLPPFNQATGPVLVQARIVITGASSATSCTIKLRRGGSSLAGADILASDPVVQVAGSAIDVDITVSAIETAANFNANSGIYTVSANAAGAAQVARLAAIELEPLGPGV